MRPLTKKLWRDVRVNRGPAAAIALVIGAGIALYVLLGSCLESLQWTLDDYYSRQRFADVFATLERAPLSTADAIRAIPGVTRVETRVVVDVTLDVRGVDEPATGRLISYPAGRAPALNAPTLRQGRLPEADAPDEVLVSEIFANANRLAQGDTLAAIVNGRLRTLRVVGLALSPEYVYSIRPGELFPDERLFGVLWMNERDLAAAFQMEGGFNDLSLQLGDGASSEEVIRRVDEILRPYGGFGAIPRALQTSHWYLENELNGLRKFGKTVPMIFLAVAGFLLNVVLTRLVSVQREQIAALKALGYDNRSLALHYVCFGLIVASFGALVGTALGTWLGSSMAQLYAQFFHFPELVYRLPLGLVAEALSVGALAATLGSLTAVWRAVKLPPAEAMRPEPPARYRPAAIERVGFATVVSQPARIVLRNLERNPGRALVSVLGIASGAALLIGGTFSFDSMDRMVERHFTLSLAHDAMVSFESPVSPRAIHELQRLPGIIHAEGFRAVPVRLRAGHRSRQTSITSLDPDSRLHRVVGMTDGVVDPPAHGLLLSQKLAEVLRVKVGDHVEVEVLEGRRPHLSLPVEALVDESLGTRVYARRSALHAIMQEDEVLSGAYLEVDPARERELYEALARTPRVAGTMLHASALRSLDETLERTIGVVRSIYVVFAAVIAFGVVYNAARISLAERSRELATLRVLGFRRAEIAGILLGELAIVVALAIPLGLFLGRLFARVIADAYDTELFRLPVIIEPRTYATAALAVIGAAVLSGWTVRRRLERLDLVAVLKTRE